MKKKKPIYEDLFLEKFYPSWSHISRSVANMFCFVRSLFFASIRSRRWRLSTRLRCCLEAIGKTWRLKTFSNLRIPH